jgi:hypothetical protein
VIRSAVFLTSDKRLSTIFAEPLPEALGISDKVPTIRVMPSSLCRKFVGIAVYFRQITRKTMVETVVGSPRRREKNMSLDLEAIFGNGPVGAVVVAPATESTAADNTTAASAATDSMSDSEYNEFCWQNVEHDVYVYLTGPRNYPPPCAWCGGRLVHNPLCDELRASWQPTLPFGKHKGKSLPDVPVDYLEWLAATDDIDAGLQEVIRNYLYSEQ